MVPDQDCKYFQCIRPATVDNATATAIVIDTAGSLYATVIVNVGAIDIAISALKIQESEASDMTGATDVPGTVVGTDTQIDGTASALPTATDDGKLWVFHLPLNRRKRYLKPVVTVGDGTAGGAVSGLAILWRNDITPSTPTERGLACEMLGLDMDFT